MFLRLCRATALAIMLGWYGMMVVAQTPVQTSAQVGEDPVVARVNRVEIKRSDLILAQQALPEQYRQVPLKSIFQPLLRQMINTRLIIRAARDQGLHHDPVVKQKLTNMEGRILEQVYLKRIIESRVTDEALRKVYQNSIAVSATVDEVEVRARHILVKTKVEAIAIIDEVIKHKVDFAEVAREKSTGPSRARGGDLGFFAKGAMVKPFSDAACVLKVGESTQNPVKTQFGWHVIKLEERRSGSVPSFAKSRAKLSTEMTQRVITKAVESLRKGVTIETFGLNGGARPPTRIRRVQ